MAWHLRPRWSEYLSAERRLIRTPMICSPFLPFPPPACPPPHKIYHPQRGLPRPQREGSASASSWKGTQRMASPRTPGIWHLPQGEAQLSECADCPLWRVESLGRTRRVLAVVAGYTLQAGIPPASLGSLEAGARIQPLRRAQRSDSFGLGILTTCTVRQAFGWVCV